MGGAASRFPRHPVRLFVVILIAAPLLAPSLAWSQADPEPRAYLEAGTDIALKGNAPISGYAFFLWNKPNYPEPDQYLRVILSPTYLQSEFVQDHWPFGPTGLGIGLNGGGIRYGHWEYRDGVYKGEESFWGSGAELPLSLYTGTKLFGLLPLEAQIRVTPSFLVYQDGLGTSDRFVLPPDTGLFTGRVGIRLGGVPPELLPTLAVEVSAWYEATYRASTGTFGLPDRPERLEELSQRAWGRVAAVFEPLEGHHVEFLVTAGLSKDADLLSSFRLGSALPFWTEFPLILHGYFVEEVFAKRFWLANASYRFPAWPGSRSVFLRVSGDLAGVNFIPGHHLPRNRLGGAGADLSIAFTRRVTAVVGYGYGFDAPRDGGFGGQMVHALIEVKF